MKSIALASTVFLASVVLAGAQGTTGVHGIVTDETGAILIGVTVTLEGIHGQTYTAHTDAKGGYHFSAVSPDTYTLTCALDGFAPFTQQLDLPLSLDAVLNVTLRLSITERVDVESAALGNLSTATLSMTDLEALPDDPRLLLQHLRQMARMLGSPDEIAIDVDGFAGGRLPPANAIQAIRITGQAFAAEYREPNLGRIEVITKAAAEGFDGSLTFNLNDESLNARPAFAPRREPLQTRDYTGYLSGPIAHDRWGFSLYFSRSDQRRNEVINATILDPATLLQRPFVSTTPSPSRGASLSGRTTVTPKNQTLALSYSQSRNEAANQGVGAFDLPERAFSDSSRSDDLKVSLSSIVGSKTLNEIRIALGRSESTVRAFSAAPAVIVLDAFGAGGNQDSLFIHDVSRHLQVHEALTYLGSRHVLKVGFGGDGVYQETIDRSNFGGTFTFGADFERNAGGEVIIDAGGDTIPIAPVERYRRTLLGLPGYRPSQFSVIRGNPSVRLSQWQVAWYAQDEWNLSSRATLSYGLRHDMQTNLRDPWNVASRVGLAWRPGKARTDTLRVAAGVFYQGVSTDITFDTKKLNGSGQQEFTVQEPTFFPDVPDTVHEALVSSPSRHTKASNLRSPQSAASTVSYQAQLPWNLYGSIAYTWQRRVALLRMRNINAPRLGSSVADRAQPDVGPIFQFESTGSSIRNELRVSLSTDVGNALSVYGGYTLGSSRSDTDGPYTAPADSYNLSDEMGRASIDPHHKLDFGGSISLPWAVNVAASCWIISGSPFNITTGLDNNRDALFTDRPAFARPGDSEGIATAFGVFNPNPTPGDRIIPRNFGAGPRTMGVNASLSKTISFGSAVQTTYDGHYRLTFAADISNLTNRVNLSRPNSILTSPQFGRSNRADDPRRIDLSLRFSF